MRYDRLVERADLAFPLSKRLELYRRAQLLEARDAVLIPLESHVVYLLLSRNVHGMVGATAQGAVPLHGDWSQVSVS